MARFLAFGGSTAYGYCDTREGGFVNRIKTTMIDREYDDTRPDLQVINYAISGGQLPNIVERLPDDIERNRGLGRTICGFVVGSAESTIPDGAHEPFMPPDEFNAHLTRIQTICSEHSTPAFVFPLFIGLTPIDPSREHPHNRGTFDMDLRREYDDALRTHATSGRGAYIDVNTAFREDTSGHDLLAADGLHPSSTGHALLAKLVLEELDQIMSNTAR